MIGVDEQLARVLAACAPLPPVEVDVTTARGRLARDVAALVAIPPWDNSAMDGYAVRAGDLAGDAAGGAGVTLRIVADVPAGSPLDPPLGEGEAARIMTGAALPTDADTVVQLEHTDRDDPTASLADTVTVRRVPAPGSNVRYAGEDRRVGDVVARAGTRVTGAVRSALSSAGHGRVLVHRAPRVAVVATGSELRGAGEPLARGEIPDSNSLLVADLAARAGADVVHASRVSDEPEVLAALLERLTATGSGHEPGGGGDPSGTDTRGVDVVILTGGVSEGAFDPVKQVFAGSADVTFARVAMQPGKPQALGVLPGGTLLFGLPGNPVSAWVSFHVFVLPALLALHGAREPVAVPVPAVAAADWSTPPGREQYLPARIGLTARGTLTATPVAPLGSKSHLVGSLAHASGYAIVPVAGRRPEGGVRSGDVVAVVLTDLPDAPPAPLSPPAPPTLPDAPTSPPDVSTDAPTLGPSTSAEPQ